MPIQTGANTGLFSPSYNPASLNKRSFRASILRMYPEGGAPLFGLSAQTGKVKATQSLHTYFTKVFEYGGYTNVVAQLAAAVVFDINVDQGSIPVAGTLIRIPTTQEIIRVTGAVPGAGNLVTLTVVRGHGRVVAGAIALNEKLQVIGTSFEQGSARPTARSLLTAEVSNRSQIFRDAWAVNDTARASYVEAGYGNVGENRRDCMLLHSTGIETTLFFGQQSIRTTNGQTHTTTQGVIDSIIQYTDVGYNYQNPAASAAVTVTPNITNQAGLAMNYDSFVAATESLFAYSTDLGMGKERLAFCGPTAMRTINKMARLASVIEIYPETTTFGLAFSTIRTYKGTLRLIEHPMFNSLPGMADAVVFIDLPALKLAYLDGRDAKSETYGATSGNNNANGQDALGGSLTSELIVELVNPHACGMITGLSAAA